MSLLESVKNYLDMTWELTEQEREKLQGMVDRGKAHIDRIAGKQQDYEQEGQAKALLLDYVRYTRSSALDEFQQNYREELLSLQMYTEVQDDTQPP